MCHRVFMYDGRDKNVNSQNMVQLNIYQTYIEYVLEYLIEIDNYNY